MDGSCIIPWPGTIGGFIFNFLTFGSGACIISVMVVLDCFSVLFYASYAAIGLHSAWSLLLAIFDAAILGGGGRLLQSYRVLRVLVIGDLVTSTLTFVAGCASAAFSALYLVIDHFTLDVIPIGMGILAVIEFLFCIMTACFSLPILRRCLALLPDSSRC